MAGTHTTLQTDKARLPFTRGPEKQTKPSASTQSGPYIALPIASPRRIQWPRLCLPAIFQKRSIMLFVDEAGGDTAAHRGDARRGDRSRLGPTAGDRTALPGERRREQPAGRPVRSPLTRPRHWPELRTDPDRPDLRTMCKSQVQRGVMDWSVSASGEAL